MREGGVPLTDEEEGELTNCCSFTQSPASVET